MLISINSIMLISIIHITKKTGRRRRQSKVILEVPSLKCQQVLIDEPFLMADYVYLTVWKFCYEVNAFSPPPFFSRDSLEIWLRGECFLGNHSKPWRWLPVQALSQVHFNDGDHCHHHHCLSLSILTTLFTVMTIRTPAHQH